MRPFDHLEAALDEAAGSVRSSDEKLTAEEVAFLRDLEQWIQAVFASAIHLLPKEGLTNFAGIEFRLPRDRALVAGIAKADFCQPDLELLLLNQGSGRVFASLDRCLSLLPHVLIRPVNRFTENYLGRVGLLYVWGFEPETYVMCRAVLDSALQELLPGEQVRYVLKWKDSAQVGLGHRIQLARFTEPPILDERTWRLAFWLKEDGNDVVHHDPEHHLHFPSCLEAIDGLIDVLETLPASADGIAVRPWPTDAAWRPEPV